MKAFLLAFALTSAVEMPIHARALRRRSQGGWGRTRWLLAFAASAWTHPVVYLVLPRVLDPHALSYLVLAETFAVLVEAAWLRALGVEDAIRWSLVANASSVAVGAALRVVGVL